ncbi:MAG: hypothetical protein JNK82_17425 [Myxococcaceae bacterium]|nr:hypothetical protein [Myxococcaceae bacterium]
MTRDVRIERILWGVALVLGVSPLWATSELPLVDLPQHLHLISVLHRLDDPSTLFPELFARRPELTPYLGYYYLVSLLNWLLPLELANRVFLTAYVAGLPLALAFLLRSVKRPSWPALLAVPFAYGDSFAWGFINYVSALPLTLLTCGLFVRTIQDAANRRRWAIGLGVSLVAVLLFHVQAFAYLGVALPFLLLTTKGELAGRKAAVFGVLPGVVTFIAWVGLRLGQPAEIAPGQPWKSWGPLLSKENLAWKPFEANRAELVPTLSNMLPDGSDRFAVLAAVLVAAFGVLASVWKLELKQSVLKPVAIVAAPALFTLWSRASSAPNEPLATSLLEAWSPWVLPVMIAVLAGGAALSWLRPSDEGEAPVERLRLLGLALIALVLFFALPFDIRGYMYYLNTRYAHLAAPLALASVPAVLAANRRVMLVGAALVAGLAGLMLSRGFSRFDDEAKQLTSLVAYAGPKPRVMGLVYQTGSRAVTHPVYLHASTVLARLNGGVTNFSFALTPHSPVMYRGAPPPTFPSEWRPDQMSWESQGRWYDHFIVRGAHPRQILGQLLDSELYVAGQAGDFFLVKKR